MKQKDIKELKQKSEAELNTLVSDSRAKLQQLTFDLAQGKVKNVGEVRVVRKTIARALTFLQMKKNTAK